MKLDELKEKTDEFIGICEKAGRYYDVHHSFVERDESQGPQVIVLHQAVVLHQQDSSKTLPNAEEVTLSFGPDHAVDVCRVSASSSEPRTEDVG